MVIKPYLFSLTKHLQAEGRTLQTQTPSHGSWAGRCSSFTLYGSEEVGSCTGRGLRASGSGVVGVSVSLPAKRRLWTAGKDGEEKRSKKRKEKWEWVWQKYAL